MARALHRVLLQVFQKQETVAGRVPRAFISSICPDVREKKAYNPMSHIDRDLLVVDFDDTCTVGDTISHLVSSTMRRLGGDCVDEEKSSLYEQLAREYISKRKHLMDDLLLPSAREIEGDSWLETFLDGTSAFDVERNSKALDSKLLAGASMNSIRQAARSVEFRPGCIETLSQALDNGMHVAIVSVHWSSEFIQCAFEHDGRVPTHRTANFEDASVLLVGNSLEFDQGRTTGVLQHTLCQSATDKRAIMRNLNRSYRSSIYVGDSITDIGPLLEASVGIIMGDDALLRQVLEYAGVTVVPVHEYTGNRGCSMTLFHTHSWSDIWKIWKYM